MFINVQNYGIDQNFVQRYMTTCSVKRAKSSTLFGSLLYLPVSLLFFYIGTALYSYYTAQPELLPAELQDPQRAGDKIFPILL